MICLQTNNNSHTIIIKKTVYFMMLKNRLIDVWNVLFALHDHLYYFLWQ